MSRLLCSFTTWPRLYIFQKPQKKEHLMQYHVTHTQGPMKMPVTEDILIYLKRPDCPKPVSGGCQAVYDAVSCWVDGIWEG